MGIHIPLLIFGILCSVGVVGLIAWQLKSARAAAHRWDK